MSAGRGVRVTVLEEHPPVFFVGLNYPPPPHPPNLAKELGMGAGRFCTFGGNLLKPGSLYPFGGNLLKPGSLYFRPTTDRRPLAEELKYSRNRARRH